MADAHRAAQEDGHRAGVPGGRTVGAELLERDMILMGCMEPSSAGAAPDNRWPARLWAWLGSVASRVGRRGGGRVYKDGEWSNVR